MSIATAQDTKAPVEVIEDLYAAFFRNDMDAILGLIDADVDWSVNVDVPGGENVPMFRNGRGHDAVLAYFAGVAEMDIDTFDPKHFFVDGDTVVVVIDMGFTHRRTGRRVDVEEVHHFTVENGRIVRYRPFVDTAAFIEAFRT